jgi:VIT1/CCC1 family predicted Fe2+/Mn2+ transporter
MVGEISPEQNKKNMAYLALGLFCQDISLVASGKIPEDYISHSEVMKEAIKELPKLLRKELEGIISVADEQVKYLSAREEVKSLEENSYNRLKKLIKVDEYLKNHIKEQSLSQHNKL